MSIFKPFFLRYCSASYYSHFLLFFLLLIWFSKAWRRNSEDRFKTGWNCQKGFTWGKTGRWRHPSHRPTWINHQWPICQRHRWFMQLYQTQRLWITRIYQVTSRTCMADVTPQHWFLSRWPGLNWKRILIWILLLLKSVDHGGFIVLWEVKAVIAV